MKKILINYYSFGNMDFIQKYYEVEIKEKYKEKIKVINTKDISKKNKFFRIVSKVFLSMKSYDIVISDYPTKLFSSGKKGIYISHGYGTKMTPGKDEINDVKKLNNYKKLVKNLSYVITMSDRDEKYFLKEEHLQRVSKITYMPLGLPRNDVLFDKLYVDSKYSYLRKKLGIDGRIILFCPTWRGYKSEKEFPITREDFEKFNKFLKENNYTLCYRPHPIEKLFDDNLIENLSNIKYINSEIFENTQDLLCAVDMLITDYSSIYVDYLVLNRPIVFIAYDKDKYDDYRGVVIDFESNIETPGPKVNSVEDIKKYILETESGKDIYTEYREKAIDIFYNFKDNNSTKRVWDFIIKELGTNNK